MDADPDLSHASPPDDRAPAGGVMRPAEDGRAEPVARFPLLVAVSYTVISALWIIVSDRAVSALFAENITAIQTYKGWVFILVTASLLFLVLLRENRRRRAVEDALRDGEVRLRRERSLFEAVLRQAPVGISIVGAPDGRTLVLNERAVGMMQIKETGDARRHVGYGPLHADGRSYAVKDYPTIRALCHGDVVEREAMAYHRPDGRMLEFEVSSAPVRDDSGVIAAAVTVIVDVTVAKAAERALVESEERLRRAIEDAPFPVMVHAADGEIVHISRTWLEATGYSRDVLATTQDWTKLAYRERWAEVQADIDRLYMLDHPLDEGEYTIHTADGRTRTWVFRSSPIGQDARGRSLVVSMAVDLTERKEAEGRLRLLMREVDHRAKNALAVVQSIVLLSRAEDPAEFAGAVEGRVTAMARAHALLAASSWAGADLATLVEEGLRAFPQGEHAAISGPPVAIAPEAAQSVSMALHELATNAARCGALSAPQGRVAVSWSVDVAAGSLVLSWTENGGPPVMPPKRHGFGSMLLEQTIEGQLRGELARDWNPAGLRCRITLPHDCFVVDAVCKPADQPGHMVETQASPVCGGRVLVVEDEALTALALEQVLRSAGYDVVGPVGRVQDALNLIGASPPDAAVLDVNLYGQPSFPVAETLDAMGVPFVFCTGYGSVDGASARLRQAPVLAKPVPPDRLIGAVATLLASGPRPVADAVRS